MPLSQMSNDFTVANCKCLSCSIYTLLFFTSLPIAYPYSNIVSAKQKGGLEGGERVSLRSLIFSVKRVHR